MERLDNKMGIESIKIILNGDNDIPPAELNCNNSIFNY